MLTLSEKSWWVKSYNQLCTLSNLLSGKSEDFNHLCKFSMDIDICKFARRFLVWGPLATTFYALYYSALFVILIMFPIKFIGVSLTFIALGWLLLYAVTGITAILGVVYIIHRIVEYRKNKSETDKEPGVVSTWYTAVKSKTCAFMRISE